MRPRGRLAAALVLVLATATGGCQSKVPAPAIKVPPLAPPSAPGSLWQEENGRAYLYEDMRAMRVGDLVTVKIVENHSGSKSADTTAERESTLSSAVSGNTFGIPGMTGNSALAQQLSVDASTSNAFEGSGATTRSDTLTGTISAIVTEVLPNGDLRIEGRREVTVNSETQIMTLTGIVRRVDVDTRNTVLSTAIADARIEYSGLGVVNDVQRPGWFVRIFDWLYPF